MARGSLTAPLVCALFEQETIVWARNNNMSLFLGLFLSPFLELLTLMSCAQTAAVHARL